MEVIGAGERLYKVEFVGGSEMMFRAYNPDAARRAGSTWARRNRSKVSSPVVRNATLVKETPEERAANQPHVSVHLGTTHLITPEKAKFDRNVRTMEDAMTFLKANPGTEFFKVSYNGFAWCFYGKDKPRDYCESYVQEVTDRFIAGYRKMSAVRLNEELFSIERRGRAAPSNDLRWQFARVGEELKKRISK